jgi:hypothetical protein
VPHRLPDCRLPVGRRGRQAFAHRRLFTHCRAVISSSLLIPYYKNRLSYAGKICCTIIKFPNDRLTAIDIDNSHIDDNDDELTDPIWFLDTYYPKESLFRFIFTHPDMDQMTWLFHSRVAFCVKV